MREGRPKAVIFDMGNVLIGWDARARYRAHFDSDAALDAFFRALFREIYDAVHDDEREMEACLAPLKEKHPHARHLIEVYEKDWGSFLTGLIEESVALVHALHGAGVRLYGLTNWPHQVWPPHRAVPGTKAHYAFLDLFEDVLVSGQERLRKPDPEIYRLALSRFRLSPGEALFVDDLAENIAAAEALGMHGHVFETPAGLHAALCAHGLLPDKGRAG